MTNVKMHIMPDPAQAIVPFKVQQALVALNWGDSEDKLLDYLDFFARQIPIAEAEFLHVLPTFDLFNAIFQREGTGVVSNYELNEEAIREMKALTQAKLEKQSIGKVRFDVREGNPLEELLQEAEEIKADLIVIGQKSAADQHGILARNLARKAEGNALIVPEASPKRLRRILVPIDLNFKQTPADTPVPRFPAPCGRRQSAIEAAVKFQQEDKGLRFVS